MKFALTRLHLPITWNRTSEYSDLALNALCTWIRTHNQDYCHRIVNRQVNRQVINENVNVNVQVYSPDIPVGSADYTIFTPGIGTHSFTVSSPMVRIQHLRTLLQL